MAPLSTAFLARLNGLPLELKAKILCYVAAQEVGQLQAVRGLSHFDNKTILIDQYDIVSCALSRQGSLYNTAHRLYRGLYRPVKPNFQYLFGIARRCEIASGLSRALADKLVKGHPSLRLRPLEVASYDRFVKNIEPYIIVLAHFLESYRDGLADYAPMTGSNHTPCDWVEASILDGYSKETGLRIACLYHMLKCILDRELKDLYDRGLLCNVFDFQSVPRVKSAHSLDIFIFGGVEAVKDILAEPNSTLYPGIVRDHLARACPYFYWASNDHRLPRSTLPQRDQATDMKTCFLLPDYPFEVLDIRRQSSHKISQKPAQEQPVFERFYDYLITHEGDKASLMREG